MASSRATPTSEAARRRAALLSWMRERSGRQGLSAAQIADLSGIYEGHGRYDRCLADLKALAKAGELDRSGGRPARWTA